MFRRSRYTTPHALQQAPPPLEPQAPPTLEQPPPAPEASPTAEELPIVESVPAVATPEKSL